MIIKPVFSQSVTSASSKPKVNQSLVKPPLSQSAQAIPLSGVQAKNVFQSYLRFGADPDHRRYKSIVKGLTRKDIRELINPEELEVLEGGKRVRIPKHVIQHPEFTRGGPTQGQGGVGAGDGEPGTPIGQTDENGEPQEGTGKAGADPGGHLTEEWTMTELIRSFPEWTLPNRQPKGEGKIKEKKYVFNDVRRVGPKMLLKETMRNTIERTIIEQGSENIDPDDLLDKMVIEPQDVRYRSYNEIEIPLENSVVIYIMDVSGSMTDEQKRQARTSCTFLSGGIKVATGEANAAIRGEDYSHDKDYGEGVEEVFIVHDAAAKEVSEHDFYHTRESGGTRISNAYRLAKESIEKRYPPDQWNVYMFHYSDGDNWSEDNRAAIELIDELLPQVNEIGFLQLESPYGSGEFLRVLENKYGKKHVKMRLAEIKSNATPDEFFGAIGEMLSEREGGTKNG